VSITRIEDETLPLDGVRTLGLPSRPRIVGARTTALGQRAARRPPAVESLLAFGAGEVTLALIGGQRLLRDATASLLTHEEGLRVLSTFESVAHYRAAGTETPPAILLLDREESESPDWHGTIGELCSLCPARSIVLLVGGLREDVVRCAIEHGVGGVILKSYTAKQIREAITYIATGRTVMPAGWQRTLATAACKPQGLSPRQREILALVAHGRGNDAIAAQLGVSSNTVKFHIRELYARLGVRNRVEAANHYAQMTRGGC
jgi:DNA-binding NarL/FixJ family response regulator